MILVTGASGFVGHKIMEMCKDAIAAPSLRGITETVHIYYVYGFNSVCKNNGYRKE